MFDETKQSIEFDYAQRIVTLREYQTLYCAFGWDLMLEQQLPFDRIDGFKCVQSAAIGLASGHVVVLAIKPSLEQASVKHNAAAPNAASTAPAYTWPFFIDRAIFEGGDLLLLSVHQNNAEKKTATNLKGVNLEKKVFVSADVEKLIPIVEALNVRLVVAEA
jgi:hypothetical protein